MAGSCHLSRGFTSICLPTCYRSPTHFPFNSALLSNNRSTTKLILNKPRKFGIRAMESRLEDTVKKTIAHNPLVVYSKTWCSYSSEVKSLFNRLGVQPLVVELDQLGSQGPQLQKVLESLTGQRTVPNIFIGGKHIGGCSVLMRLFGGGSWWLVKL